MQLVERIKTAEVAAAVEAGDIKAYAATIKAKGADGKEYEAPFTAFEPLTIQGAMILCGSKTNQDAKPESDDEAWDKEWGLLDHVAYSIDLALRQARRQVLLASIEGPDKLITKAAEALVKGGIYDDLASARAYVVEQRKAKGLPV